MCEIRNTILAQLTSNIKQSARNSLVLKEAQYDKVEYASGCIALINKCRNLLGTVVQSWVRANPVKDLKFNQLFKF